MSLRLSERLRQARIDAGMTQTELAKKTGRTQAYISKFERGQLRLDVSDYIIFTKVLNFDAHALLDELAQMPPDKQEVSQKATPPPPPKPPRNFTEKQFWAWLAEYGKWMDKYEKRPMLAAQVLKFKRKTTG